MNILELDKKKKEKRGKQLEINSLHREWVKIHGNGPLDRKKDYGQEGSFKNQTHTIFSSKN